MDAFKFLWVFNQIKELPFVGFGKVEKFVFFGANSEVLRNVVLSFFVVGIVERFSPVLRSAFEMGAIDLP